ncbi:MAG: hypothetical protein ABI339_04290 [Solirubrobacteraceae bacterium]
MADTVTGLTRFPRRGACTNAERRAATWLAGELRSDRREAIIETFWCRPNWALAHAWHAGLAVLGSLLTVASPKVGGAIIIVALLSVLCDGLLGVSLGRRLTPERASQNVVSPPPSDAPPVRLIITANYDAGRMGLVHRPWLRRPAAGLRNLLGPLSLGWLGSLVLACAWVLVTAVLRNGGSTGSTVAVLQLIPTAALVLAFALLLELGSSGFGPAAGDNATGTALAVALARALDVAPPQRLAVEIVLQGAGDGAMLGLSHHLGARRRELDAGRAIVLGLGPAGAGRPRWWTSDGPLIPLRFLPRLAQLAAEADEAAHGPPADAKSEPTARPHRGRGVSPAYPARLRSRPAITIGALDAAGIAPHSHLPTDTAENLDRIAADRLLELALTLVDAIDADLPATAAPNPRGAPGGPTTANAVTRPAQ